MQSTDLAHQGKCISRMSHLAPSNFHTSDLAEENMTDSTGRIIKNITEAAAGAQTYYIVQYRDGSCKTYTRATGVITAWLAKNS